MSNAWLKDLEDKVHAAAEALRALRRENEELRARIEKLEAEAPATDAAGWAEEREDVRERVEKLAEHLAGLLGES